MATVPAPASVKVEKPSFAKIVAAGIKPPIVQQRALTNINTLQTHAMTSSPRVGSNIVTPSYSPRPTAPVAQPRKLVQLAAKTAKESDVAGTSKPEVLVHAAASTEMQVKDESATDGLLAPASSDENGTQVSSSSGSAKPPSLDGKSVASGTTFALDEKESLRPDDSASVKAIDEEDVFSPPPFGLPESQTGSEDGVRAFRDQLREISSMDPSRRGVDGQAFRPNILPPQGVLYVPPQGSGVGVVPPIARFPADANREEDVLPDPKLLEALESPRDRIWVLKLEQDIYDFVKDAKEAALDLPQCNAYHRMLAHKIADYYLLGHVVDDSGDGVRLYKTPNCRIPPPLTGITTPSTAASTPPPAAHQMKILRRGQDSNPAIANGSGLPSKTASENGDSGNEDDRKNRPPASREEREARYEAARLRIMGSAKPVEGSEPPKEVDESRSSSAAGVKYKKKQRSDSEDGFEARSAYSAFYTPPYSAAGFNPQPAPYSVATLPSSNLTVTPPVNFVTKEPLPAYQHFQPQSLAPASWNTQAAYATANGGHGWTPGQQAAYELSNDFHRSMSFQSPPQGQQPPPTPQQAAYSPQYYGALPTWPHQNFQVPAQPKQPLFGMPTYPNRPQPTPHQGPQPYAYGQLPSQTFPGRPPNRLEHPLPGSYKSKHFNPQSQAFVPAQPNGNAVPSFTHHDTSPSAGFSNPYNMPAPAQRQHSAHLPHAPFGPPPHAGSPMALAQPMLHPLPQPVFPRQASPSLPLPAKPPSVPHPPVPPPSMPSHAMLIANAGQSPSTIAKWGAPASLPAKPPPPVEPFDPARFPQLQRPALLNTAAVARVPGGVGAGFGMVASPGVGVFALTGSGPQTVKRV